MPACLQETTSSDFKKYVLFFIFSHLYCTNWRNCEQPDVLYAMFLHIKTTKIVLLKVLDLTCNNLACRCHQGKDLQNVACAQWTFNSIC